MEERETSRSEQQADVEIRPLEEFDEYLASLELQKETWGENFNGLTSPAIQIVAQKIGGLAVGAFASSDELVGLAFGLPGLRDGELVHWSHMVAVRSGWRGRGIGLRLKRCQRARVLEQGVKTICWTYDPLEAVNAHFNVNRLGVRIDEYACDLYGSGESSTLHRGIGTDRFIARWPLKSGRVKRALDGRSPGQEKHNQVSNLDQAPNVSTGAEGAEAVDPEAIVPEANLRAEADLLRVEIPADIQSIKTSQPNRALQWREATREAFTHYLNHGYEVDGFYRTADSERCFYVLPRTS